MVKPLNKEWEFFGHKYRVPGAKIDKVDCKACHKQVAAAVNRLQSHMRICPARSSYPTALVNSINVGSSGSGVSDTIPTTSELIEQAIRDGKIAEEQVTVTNANVIQNNAPPMKKQRVSTRPRSSTSSANIESAMNVDNAVHNSVEQINERRLEVEEKRLQLEIKRDQREEIREQLSLQLLKAQVRKETLLAEKEEYEAKVLLALSRKQLRDQGVSEEEIDRILPIPSSQIVTDRTSATDTNVTPTESSRLDDTGEGDVETD
ncbi:hypothetical protein P3T76_009217 [Phytophthora citrophthora]|uniref:BED-type domain-containing protein n=1 Tax=Phytophthora citrophthora TaxID=4793 RepID=A0AAD9GGI3_9STRA|nr:hypothetical protein P3T76_009217 [Phytophthora citrophthora]